MICQVSYHHKKSTQDPISSVFKNFEADSVDGAQKKGLSIIQQSAKRWKKRSQPMGCVLFLREAEEGPWTQVFFLRFNYSKNLGQLFRARSPKCWRAYGEDTQD